MPFNVLIVDDSRVMRGVIARTLSMLGYDPRNVLQAEDGAQALEKLTTRDVDLIFTDINMPVMNGEEFLRALVQDERFRAIPVLVLSTDASHARLEQMLSLGAKGYIVKPFTPELLRAQLQRVLGGSDA